MPTLALRLAKPDEANLLTNLAMRAKASWGYSDAFMEACRDELTVTPAAMAAWTVWVAQSGPILCGMIALDLKGGSDTAELEDFFVDPDFQGQGVGKILMAALLDECRAHGVEVVGLDADPFAEAIYHRLGFSTVGSSPSKSIPGRRLPRMELSLPSSSL
jgi:GNAT superfamily N-acetyltransferase